jgi:ATP-binding cassette subfamily A (ABC1) protein 3
MRASAVLRQTWALVRKNLIINARRHFLSTLIRASLLPIIFVGFLSYSRILLVPPSRYGIGSPAPVRELADAVASKPGTKFVFVNNGLGGEVDTLIDTMRRELSPSGTVLVLQDEVGLRTECKQSLRGVSMCFAAVVFEGSPNTGNTSRWQYTVRGDVAFSDPRVDVKAHDSDVQK